MRKRIFIPAGLIVALCGLTISAAIIDGAGRNRYRAVLGLPGVHIKIILKGFDELHEQGFDLTEQQVKAEVESIFRAHRVRVFSENELVNVLGRPVFSITMRALAEERAGMATINIQFQLTEDAFLRRNQNMEVRGETWSGITTVLEKFDDLEIVSEAMERGVLRFCGLYSALNPGMPEDKFVPQEPKEPGAEPEADPQVQNQ